ncbi:MAG: exodeoxyribonuclease III [Candidatus Nanopelagicales bacterium]|jgi:exodeoxyribonuclease-3
MATKTRPALRVVTANLNGVRAALRRGGLAWLAQSEADVLCLQEVRATHEQLHEALADGGIHGWYVAHSPAPQLGRAGVAVLTREQPTAVRERCGVTALEGQGRWIEVDVPSAVGPVTVVSVYVHTGEADTPRQVEKYAFLDAMDARMETLRRSAARRKGHAIVCGDLNVAHREVDIKNWKGNRGKAGFLEDERAHFDTWLARHWVDLGRAHGGEGPGPYTWWSWRGQAFDVDTGWRIDYLLATTGLAGRCRAVTIGRAASYAERWSDHAPVMADFA